MFMCYIFLFKSFNFFGYSLLSLIPKRILQCAGFTVPRPVSSESLIHQTWWGSFSGPSHGNLDYI